MNPLSQLTAATFSLEYQGTQYTLSPLTIGDLGEFAQWAEDQAIAKIERYRKLGMEPATCAEKLKAVYEASVNGELESAAMVTMQGVCQLLYLSLRKHHADIPIDQVGRMVELAGLQSIRDRIDRLSGLEPEPGGADPNASSPETEAGRDGEASSDT